MPAVFMPRPVWRDIHACPFSRQIRRLQRVGLFRCTPVPSGFPGGNRIVSVTLSTCRFRYRFRKFSLPEHRQYGIHTAAPFGGSPCTLLSGLSSGWKPSGGCLEYPVRVWSISRTPLWLRRHSAVMDIWHRIHPLRLSVRCRKYSLIPWMSR